MAGELRLFDTHCHLFLMDGEPDAVVAASRDAGVEGLVCVGIDAESSRRSRELADALSGVFATAGVHPHSASEFDATAGAAIEELAQDPRVVAIGETGARPLPDAVAGTRAGAGVPGALQPVAGDGEAAGGPHA